MHGIINAFYVNITYNTQKYAPGTNDHNVVTTAALYF